MPGSLSLGTPYAICLHLQNVCSEKSMSLPIGHLIDRSFGYLAGRKELASLLKMGLLEEKHKSQGQGEGDYVLSWL